MASRNLQCITNKYFDGQGKRHRRGFHDPVYGETTNVSVYGC